MANDNAGRHKQKKQSEVPGGITLKATPMRLGIFILLVSFAVYGNALFNGFVYDDTFQILGNHWIRDINYIPEIFSQGVWSFKNASLPTNYYRPLIHIIYMAAYHLFGLQPWGFHLVNILFHAGVSVLVFLIALRLLGRMSPLEPRLSPARTAGEGTPVAPAFIAAVLFALHPVHTEAVAWAAGVTDVAFTFFYLLSLFLYIGSGAGFTARYGVSLAAFLAAALLKEPALTLPVMLIGYDYAFRNEVFRLPGTWKRWFPYFAVAGLYLILRRNALGGMAPFSEGAAFGVMQYVVNVMTLFTQYLEKLLVPVNLNLWHQFNPFTSLSSLRGILSFIVTAAFLAVLAVSSGKNRPVFFGLLLILLPLLPTFYITGIHGHPFAERYLYLPSVGFSILLALAVSWLMTRKPARLVVLAVCVATLAGLYALGTVKRNALWKDDYTLFTDTVRKSPEADDPRVSLGNALSDKGRIDEAIEQYQAALTINPKHAMAHSNLANALVKKGLIDEAIGHYQASLTLSPNYDEGHNNLGGAFQKKGMMDKAIEHYLIALRLTPGFAEARYNLGLAYGEKGLPDQAIEQFKLAIGLRPGFVQAYYTMGLMYGEKGLLDPAIEQFIAALRLDPNAVAVHDSLGVAYREKGLVEKAIEQFQNALKLNPEYAPSHYNLGKAYERQGLRDEAIRHFRRALELAPDNPLFRGALGLDRK